MHTHSTFTNTTLPLDVNRDVLTCSNRRFLRPNAPSYVRVARCHFHTVKPDQTSAAFQRLSQGVERPILSWVTNNSSLAVGILPAQKLEGEFFPLSTMVAVLRGLDARSAFDVADDRTDHGTKLDFDFAEQWPLPTYVFTRDPHLCTGDTSVCLYCWGNDDVQRTFCRPQYSGGVRGWLWWNNMRNAALSDSPAARNGSLKLPLAEYTFFSSKTWPRSYQLDAYSDDAGGRFTDPHRPKIGTNPNNRPSEELMRSTLARRKALWSFIEKIPGRTCEESRAAGFVEEGEWWPRVNYTAIPGRDY